MWLADDDIRAQIFALAVEQGLVLLELAPERTNLEEVFRRLTVGAAPASAEQQPAESTEQQGHESSPE